MPYIPQHVEMAQVVEAVVCICKHKRKGDVEVLDRLDCILEGFLHR
jgi:hypothetical protein